MTSLINPNNIDGTFPVAGQDNSSQGFRDNFTNTKNNFQIAAAEISALQANAVLSGQTNEFDNSILSNVALKGGYEVTYDFGAVSGAQTYTYGNGSYQIMQLAGSVVLTLAGFATTTNRAVTVKLRVYVPNTNYTITWPASVNKNLSTIANTSGQVTSFTSTGYYEFVLTSTDSATSWSISDTTRTRNLVQGNLALQAVVGASSINGIIMTVTNVGGQVYGSIRANAITVDTLTTSTNSMSVTSNVTANNIVANGTITCDKLIANTANIVVTNGNIGNFQSMSITGNANVGNVTVTNMTDMCGGTMYGFQTISLGNGGSQQIWSNVGAVIVTFTSNISAATLTMPSNPGSGQAIKIAFGNNTCSTLTQGVPVGQTSVFGQITAANAWAGGTWMYSGTTTSWYRVG